MKLRGARLIKTGLRQRARHGCLRLLGELSGALFDLKPVGPIDNAFDFNNRMVGDRQISHAGEVMAEEMPDESAGHDMSALGVDPEVHIAPPMGQSLSVEFTPSMPGEYEYFCTVAGHKEVGMVGTLVVKAP